MHTTSKNTHREDKNTQNKRKAGKRKEDLSDESTSHILKIAKQLVRTDFGGSSDPLEVIRKKMMKKGVKAGPQSCTAIKELLEEQVKGCRDRIGPRIDEAIRRLENKEAIEIMK